MLKNMKELCNFELSSVFHSYVHPYNIFIAIICGLQHCLVFIYKPSCPAFFIFYSDVRPYYLFIIRISSQSSLKRVIQHCLGVYSFCSLLRLLKKLKRMQIMAIIKRTKKPTKTDTVLHS